MKIKVVLCNCKGTCASFRMSDFNTLPFLLESDLEIQFAVVHPQLYGQGGNEALTDILIQSAAQPDTYVLCAACDPEAQSKLFRKILRKTGFPADRFVAVDIRNTNNDGVVARIRETIEGLQAVQPELCGS